MEWMILPLRRYADFSGRSRRKEYWMFTLLQLIVYGAAAIVGGIFALIYNATAGGSDAGGVFAVIFVVLFVIVALGLIIPNIAVTVRRFHDQDKSGWFILLNFIPYVGGFVVLVFMCLEGTRGANRYGDDPKSPSHFDVFA